MNREEVNRMLPVMQAFAEGKAIQFRLRPQLGGAEREWKDADQNVSFSPVFEWRIKPVPTRVMVWINPRTGEMVKLKPSHIHDVWKANGWRLAPIEYVEVGAST